MHSIISPVDSIEYTQLDTLIIIRLYRTSQVLSLKDGDRDPEPDQKLQDLVNKTMWKKCCFSGDGEYVCAGSARQVLTK